MTVLCTNAGATQSLAMDTAAIKTIVESVAILADRHDFEALETLFADEIHVDYTSLVGGEPVVQSPQGLMTEWAGVLPGFDRTRHAISNIRVELDGERAVATADVTADHYVADLAWQVEGQYRYELVRSAGQWRITATAFRLLAEAGTRDVFSIATKNAAEAPPPYVVRQQSQQTVLKFLDALENKDMAGLAAVWHERAVLDMPFSPPGHPKRVVGKNDLVALYADWPKNAGRADFTSQLVLYPMRDPEMVFAEFHGDVDIIPTARRYRQRYGGLFHVSDGKIQLLREYFDPAPFAWAFGLAVKE
ncbi:MAG: nuclear transport factor 2 family protein [Pseudomonadota bacterium]